jgi:hypothetical protein
MGVVGAVVVVVFWGFVFNGAAPGTVPGALFTHPATASTATNAVPAVIDLAVYFIPPLNLATSPPY